MTEDLGRNGPPPARYLCGDDPIFERTAEFEAAYNRVLVYQSFRLHSGSIPADFDFDPDPRAGRLTANTVPLLRLGSGQAHTTCQGGGGRLGRLEKPALIQEAQMGNDLFLGWATGHLLP